MKSFLKVSRHPILYCMVLMGIFLTANGFLFDEKPGFAFVNILQNLPYHYQWEADSAILESLEAAFDQPFVYLAEGKQSFAFESHDHQYVIKFLKTKRVRKKRWFFYWQNWLKFSTPLPLVKFFFQKRELTDLCDRYFLAFNELPEESAIVHVHLNKTPHLLRSIMVIDSLGKLHKIDLDRVPFVLQKKVRLAPAWIQELLSNRDIEGAKAAIFSLRHLLVSRVLKGFTDDRQVFSKNYGFIKGEAVQIDIGKIRRIDHKNESSHKEISRLCKNLKSWVGRHYPLLHEELADFENISFAQEI